MQESSATGRRYASEFKPPVRAGAWAGRPANRSMPRWSPRRRRKLGEADSLDRSCFITRDLGVCSTPAERWRPCWQESGAAASISRRGNCYDDAMLESFWATSKTECFAGEKPPTREAARLQIFDTSKASTTGAACIGASATNLLWRSGKCSATRKINLQENHQSLVHVFEARSVARR